MTRLKYETLTGNLDPKATFDQLIEYLRLMEEDAQLLRKLRKIDNDDVGGEQWGAVARRFEMTRRMVEELANEKTKTSIGYGTSH